MKKTVTVTFDRAMDTRGISAAAFAIFGRQELGFGMLGWKCVGWEEYNRQNGETWPACGDGPIRAELLVRKGDRDGVSH